METMVIKMDMDDILEDLVYSINIGICWVCHSLNHDDSVKAVAFFNDDKDYGYCVKHLRCAAENWIMIQMKNETLTKTYSVATEIHLINIKAVDLCTNDDGTLELVNEIGDTLAAFAPGVWRYAYLRTAVESE
jgi:hypothetical protein